MINLELKTRVIDQQDTLRKINELEVFYGGCLDQTDYYLKIGSNKEKIRQINDGEIQLISYHRKEHLGQKNSVYEIKILSVKQKDNLIKENQPVCIVHKIRKFWIYKHTRIHFDYVDNLGYFLELETVITDMPKKLGLKEFSEVTKILNIDLTKTEPHSYSDLITSQHKTDFAPHSAQQAVAG